MILKVLTYPNPELNKKSQEVTVFDAKLGKLVDDMIDTMYAENGVGLAAPQVGVLQRVFVIDLDPKGPESKVFEFINPKIKKLEGKIKFEEGCLSVPGFTEEVSRSKKVLVEYQDRKGNPQKLEAEELMAVAVQHENDHLEGILFIERLSPLKRRLMKNKISKAVTL
jgi:peptide deformylase